MSQDNTYPCELLYLTKRGYYWQSLTYGWRLCGPDGANVCSATSPDGMLPLGTRRTMEINLANNLEAVD